MLGETAVGKSSLVLRFTRDRFLDFQESTIGAAFATQSVIVDGNTLKFEIWDTAGQERYHSLAPMYYRGAKAAIVVYDITSKASFERAKAWVVELQQAGTLSMVVALAGNKTDLSAQREVTQEEGQQYATEQGLLFMETSAKSNHNVTEIFATVAKHLPKAEAVQDTQNSQVVLGQTNPEQDAEACSC